MAVNVRIVRLFTSMRDMIQSIQHMLLKLEKIEKNMIKQGHSIQTHDEEIGIIFELIEELKCQANKALSRERVPIGFKTRKG